MQAHTRGAVRADVFRLGPHGWVPNNARLPVILYRDVLDARESDSDRLAEMFEAMFSRCG
jgi:hypothetical protein